MSRSPASSWPPVLGGAVCQSCRAGAVQGHREPGAPTTVWIEHEWDCPVKRRLAWLALMYGTTRAAA
jgi:hypothetical protein